MRACALNLLRAAGRPQRRAAAFVAAARSFQALMVGKTAAVRPRGLFPAARDSRERLVTWMDTYAQFLGHFSDEQERELLALKRSWAGIISNRPAEKVIA